jgi:hypothetical protein
LRVELVGEELVQRNPAALEIDAFRPGTHNLQLTLQPARRFRRALDLNLLSFHAVSFELRHLLQRFSCRP